MFSLFCAAMSQTSDNTNYDPYRIDSIQEVDQILLQLLNQGILLRMHNGNANHSVITTLVNLDFDHDTIIIDSAAQQTINEQLLSSEIAFFEAILDNVTVKFQVPAIYATTFEGRPALAGPLPTFLHRIQRRENFRIRPTFDNTAQCTLVVAEQSYQLEVHDISSKGVALIDLDEVLTEHIAEIIPNCEILLPTIGTVTVDLRLVRSQAQNRSNGKKVSLIGCAFFQPEANQQIRIQNFITAQERLQIARERGLA